MYFVYHTRILTGPDVFLENLYEDDRIAGRSTEVIRESDAQGAKDGEKGVVGVLFGFERAETNGEQKDGTKQRTEQTITSGEHARGGVAAQYVHVDLVSGRAREWKEIQLR